MTGIHLLSFPPKPMPEAAPETAPAMQECRFLQVVHVFDPSDLQYFQLAGLVATQQHEEVFDKDDHDMLMCGIATLGEKHTDEVLGNDQTYASAAVKLARGWRFVYLTQLWMPGPDRMARN